MMGMWEPSIAPMHWGNPHLDENPLTILRRPCPVGMLMYCAARLSTIAWLTSCTAIHTVEIPTPNKWLIVLYSTFVPSLQRQIATLCSRSNGVLTASLLSRWVCNSRHKKWKVALFTRKFCFHSLSLQFPAISYQKERLLCLTQTVLRCRYAVDSCRDMDSYRSSRLRARAALRRRIRALQAMSHARSERRRAACLLRSHKIERRTITRKNQTPNAIFSSIIAILTQWYKLPCETETLNPGSTRIRRPGFNPLCVGACENGITQQTGAGTFYSYCQGQPMLHIELSHSSCLYHLLDHTYSQPYPRAICNEDV